MQRKKRKTVIFTALFLAITLVPVPSNAVVKDNLADNMLLQLFTELGGQKRNKVPESEEDFDSATLAEKVNYLEDTSAKKQDVSDLITKKDLEGLPEPKEDISEYTWEEIDKILSARRAAEYGLGKVGAELRDGWYVASLDSTGVNICAGEETYVDAPTNSYDACASRAVTYYDEFNIEVGTQIADSSRLPKSYEALALIIGGRFTGSNLEIFLDDKCALYWYPRLPSYRYTNSADRVDEGGYPMYTGSCYPVIHLSGSNPVKKESSRLPQKRSDTTRYSFSEIKTILKRGLEHEYGFDEAGAELINGLRVISSDKHKLKLWYPFGGLENFQETYVDATQVALQFWQEFNTEFDIDLAYDSEIMHYSDFDSVFPKAFGIGYWTCDTFDANGVYADGMDMTATRLVYDKDGKPFSQMFMYSHNATPILPGVALWFDAEEHSDPEQIAFSQATWEQIHEVVSHGKASEYWSVGDTKGNWRIVAIGEDFIRIWSNQFSQEFTEILFVYANLQVHARLLWSKFIEEEGTNIWCDSQLLTIDEANTMSESERATLDGTWLAKKDSVVYFLSKDGISGSDKATALREQGVTYGIYPTIEIR